MSATYVDGEVSPVFIPVAADRVIARGEMVLLTEDDILAPVSHLRAESLEQLQLAVSQLFLGIALMSSAKGEAAPIRIATTGRFSIDSVARSYQCGDLVCPAVNGLSVSATQVVLTEESTHAVAIVSAVEDSQLTVWLRGTTIYTGLPVGIAYSLVDP